MKIKLTVLLFSLVAFVNCAPGKGLSSGSTNAVNSATSSTAGTTTTQSPQTIAAESDMSVTTSATPTNSSNGLLSGIGNFFNGLFGGSASASVVENMVAC